MANAVDKIRLSSHQIRYYTDIAIKLGFINPKNSTGLAAVKERAEIIRALAAADK